MLSKILGRWLNKTSTNDEQAKISNLTKHEQARLLVAKISALSGRAFNPIKAGSVSFLCVDNNILTLIERINIYIGKLESGEGLLPRDCFAEVKEITLDQFFTDSEGMYIPLDSLHLFTFTCENLFTLIGERIRSNDREIEYSIRLMSKCFNSIQNVCKAIELAGQ